MENKFVNDDTATYEEWSVDRIKELTMNKVRDSRTQNIYNGIRSGANADIRSREYTKRRSPVYGRRRVIKAIAIAAVLSLLVGGTAMAYTAYRASLQDMALPAGNEIVIPVAMPDGTIEEQPLQMISLQGFSGSPEHAAAVEWQEYLNTVDIRAEAAAADVLYKAGEWYGVPDEYWHYGVYSADMVAKLDEILEKYGLTLFGESTVYNFVDMEEFQNIIAHGPLFTDDSIQFSGYRFSDGTFQFDAMGSHSFQFRASRKGVFDDVFLNVGDLNDYTEWNYTNVHGFELILAHSSYKSLILLETGSYFIALNILSGTDTPDALESFADMIDFGQIKGLN